jgi:8-oxo-dGTP pyrophosphatase MutT (NUDIX family)
MKKLNSETLRAHKGKSFVGVSTAVAIFNRRGEIFLAQRSINARDEHGRWDVCGGGLKWGETIENNAIREMFEEFGVETNEPLYPIGVRQAFRTDQYGDKTHWVCHDHVVMLTDEEAEKVEIKEKDVFDDSGWFNLDNLPSPLHSAIDDKFISILKKTIEELTIDKT